MAISNSPIFTQTPYLNNSQATVANTNLDGATGTYVTIATGATNGTRIDRLTFTSISTTAAGQLRIYLYDGSTTRLWKTIATAAVTPSGTVQPATYTIGGIGASSLGLNLSSGSTLKFAPYNSETWNCACEGTSF